MPLIDSAYRPPVWLKGRHLQTILPAECFKKAPVAYRREIWETPDADVIALDWSKPAPRDPKAPVMVHFHGLEGSSQSHYARALMAYCAREGFRGVVVHYRGCGGIQNKKLRAYFAADAAELDWIFARIKKLFPEAPIFTMGVSLGANNLLYWAGTREEEAAKQVDAIVAVCSPLDLVKSNACISKGFSRIYDLNFTLTLKAKALEKLKEFDAPYTAEEARRIRTLGDFDDVVTSRIHGYKNALDYWTRCSSKPVLGGIRVPALVLNALNDPIVGDKFLPLPAEVSSYISLEYPAEGGHCGFPQKGSIGGIGFLPKRTFEFCLTGR